MSGAVRTLFTLAALAAAGGGGAWVDRHGLPPRLLAPLPEFARSALAAATEAAPPTGPVIYYRDPDAPAAYSAVPAKNAGGRDFVAVLASEERSFDVPAPQLAAAAPPERRIRFYRNPMGLADTSQTPKKDSMGMDYLPVYEGDEADDGTIKLSPGKLQKTGVRSEPAERRTLGATLRAPAIIQFDERRVSVVALRFDAAIDAVENVTTGQHVAKGQTLMNVYGQSLAAAAADYLAALGARAEGAVGASGSKGARRRLENLGMPEAAIAAIERTREIPASVAWPAPQDGEILERAAVTGMRAAAGDVLFRIADHSVVWALADIAERDLPLAAIGQTVSVRARAYPDHAFTGQISLIYPHLNPTTRTARVRVELQNPDGLLRADMYADAEIAVGEKSPVVTVADGAVIDSGARQVVLIDKGEGRFEPRAVKLGRHGDGRVEIREGVLEGEKVVVAANFLIDAESNLKAALSALDPAGKTP